MSSKVYDDWGREQLRLDVKFTYCRLQRFLEAEHEVTGSNDTIQRWLVMLQE